MKKIVTLLCTSLIVLLMFMGTGNSVNAAGNIFYLGPPPGDVEHPEDDNCTCHELLPLTGSERNIIVAELLKSNVFKNEKMRLKKDGYKWNGASGIEVIQPIEDLTLVGVPFITTDGSIEIHTFFIGDIEVFIAYNEALKNQHDNQPE
jgi:hypothetical protein